MTQAQHRLIVRTRGQGLYEGTSGKIPKFGIIHNYCAELRNHHTGFQLSIPVRAGRMLLGTLRHIYVFEHRRAPSTRELVLHLLGE